MFIDKIKNKNGKVIVIDGTSTSGKTSIVSELVKIVNEPYVKVAIDDFVIEVIMEQKELQLPQEQFLERIWQASDRMFDKIEQLAFNGQNVLVDTVLSGIEGEKELLHGLARLQNLNVMLILVYCPLNILAKRVYARNELAIKENNLENLRSLVGVVRFADMYRPQRDEKEIIVGQISRQEIEVAYAAPITSSKEEQELYNKIKNNLISHFGLINKSNVNITPNIKYDFIVDSSKNSPKVCAESIYANLSLFGNMAITRNCSNWGLI